MTSIILPGGGDMEEGGATTLRSVPRVQDGETKATIVELPECRCFENVNEFLKGYGSELLCNLFGPARAIVSTYQGILAPKAKGRRRKAPLVFASFCPFCGVKYPKPEEQAAVVATEEQGLGHTEHAQTPSPK